MILRAKHIVIFRKAVGVYTKNELSGQDEFLPLSLPGVTG
jgi:hypothetical protein